MIQIDLVLKISGISSEIPLPTSLSLESTWENIFEIWIDFILNNSDLKPPKAILNAKEISLTLHLTNDITIQSLNSKWRSKEETTDVLSFPALDTVADNIYSEYVEIGDIVISVDTAFRQAIEQCHSLDHEVKWLSTHALLHLLGWNHKSESELVNMMMIQDKLLNKIKNNDQKQ